MSIDLYPTFFCLGDNLAVQGNVLKPALPQGFILGLISDLHNPLKGLAQVDIGFLFSAQSPQGAGVGIVVFLQ